MTSKQIRQQFLDFFASKGHAIVDSSPVVPVDDPTLMFTNAGMNQFKDVFLGSGSRPYTRVADTQKCIRAGGKHNDLDDVGQDTYHHTFFEMLGNWSFGDYFKKEAIAWAWELLTEVWGIDKSRLHATYFEGDAADGIEPDTEAAELWKSVTDIDPSHVHPGGKKDNFWEMGETGPCGPCSEIHIDLTPDRSGMSLVNAGDPRVIELWNLVFIQFNRDSSGNLTPLPARHVDTGMGFERTCAVLQGKNSNYDTDVWTPVFAAIRKRTGAPAYQGTLPSDEATKRRNDEGTGGVASGALAGRRKEGDDGTEGRRDEGPSSFILHPSSLMLDVSYRVIADHVRCLTFALTDEALPSNEGRGYVLRRILRRAVRYGRQYMNMHEPFLCDLVEPLVAHMADAFPELRTAHGGKNVEHVIELIRDEEESFLKTLDRGIQRFNWAAGAAFIRTFQRDSTLSATCGGDLDLMVEFSRLPQGSIWEKATDYLTLMPQRFMLVKHSVLPDPKNPVREFSVEDFSPQLFAELKMAPPMLSGEDAFKLHDTYGFPVDLTELMAQERGLTVNIGEYERLMGEARELARSGSSDSKLAPDAFILTDPEEREEIQAVGGTTEFVGYESFACEAKVKCLRVGRRDPVVDMLAIETGQFGCVVLDRTPFYAEKGGQVGDAGAIKCDYGTFEVTDTRAIGDTVVHYGRCTGGRIPDIDRRSALPPGDASLEVHPFPVRVTAAVDPDTRCPTMSNHTSTHMLNWALRDVLGDHIQQKGSLVDPEKTRFDFSHNKPLTTDELARVGQLVNELIEQDLPVYAEEVPLDEALKIKSLRAVFGEKYADPVRVVSAGGDVKAMVQDPDNPEWMKYPVELCGGTHLKRTGEAERFVIASEEAVAKGIRRIVGITGEAARQAETTGQRLLAEAEALVDKPPVAPQDTSRGQKGIPTCREPARTATEMSRGLQPARSDEPLGAKLAVFQQKLNEAVLPVCVRAQLRERIAELHKRAKEEEKQAAAASGDVVMERVRELVDSAEMIDGVTVVVGEVPAAPVEALRGAIDWVRNKKGASAVLLVMVSDHKVTLVAGMSKDVVKRGVKAGDLIREVAPLVGGKGGGRPDMAQGGGGDPSGVPKAIERAKAWIPERFS